MPREQRSPEEMGIDEPQLSKKEQKIQQKRGEHEKGAEERADETNTFMAKILKKIGVDAGRDKMDIMHEEALKENEPVSNETRKEIEKKLELLAKHEAKKITRGSGVLRKPIKGGVLLEIECSFYQESVTSINTNTLKLDGAPISFRDLTQFHADKLLSVIEGYTKDYEVAEKVAEDEKKQERRKEMEEFAQMKKDEERRRREAINLQREKIRKLPE